MTYLKTFSLDKYNFFIARAYTHIHTHTHAHIHTYIYMQLKSIFGVIIDKIL